MFEIHIPSFIFGIFCCASMVIVYIFGKLAMGDGECSEEQIPEVPQEWIEI